MRLRSVGPALVIGLFAPFFPSGHAAQIDQIYEVVVTARRHSAQVCVDVAQLPTQRVVACTRALQQPVIGETELAEFMIQFSRALLGNAEMIRDGRGAALPGVTYRGMLLDLRGDRTVAQIVAGIAG